MRLHLLLSGLAACAGFVLPGGPARLRPARGGSWRLAAAAGLASDAPEIVAAGPKSALVAEAVRAIGTHATADPSAAATDATWLLVAGDMEDVAAEAGALALAAAARRPVAIALDADAAVDNPGAGEVAADALAGADVAVFTTASADWFLRQGKHRAPDVETAAPIDIVLALLGGPFAASDKPPKAVLVSLEDAIGQRRVAFSMFGRLGVVTLKQAPTPLRTGVLAGALVHCMLATGLSFFQIGTLMPKEQRLFLCGAAVQFAGVVSGGAADGGGGDLDIDEVEAALAADDAPRLVFDDLTGGGSARDQQGSRG